jgi:hypothetical protein
LQDQWNLLLARIHSIFRGRLTYVINWPALRGKVPLWFHNPLLSSIGVSEYIPLIQKPEHVPPNEIGALWKHMVKSQLDAYPK